MEEMSFLHYVDVCVPTAAEESKAPWSYLCPLCSNLDV